MEALGEVLSAYLGAGNIEAVGRLAMAALLGLVLGIDREWRDKPAGLRSHMMVSLAAASFTVLAFEIVEATDHLSENLRLDPLRVLEAVVAGIAFLGAGTIIQGRGSVQGITTGTSLWLAGALGVACGVGNYALAVTAAAFGVVILVLLGWLEARVQQKVGDDAEE